MLTRTLDEQSEIARQDLWLWQRNGVLARQEERSSQGREIASRIGVPYRKEAP